MAETTVGLAELEPGEVPSHWKNIPYKSLQYAITFGLVIPDYTCRHYVEYSIEKGFYETIEIWGIQGSYKSNRTLQVGYWAYQDWDRVLENLVFLPDAKNVPNFRERGFIQKLKSIGYGKRIPFVGWDDITVHFPSSSWRTHIEEYEAIDSCWAAIRTKVSVITINNPLIDRLAKNIKDNVTIEIFLGRNCVELIERYVRLPGLKEVESNFFKVQVEPLHKFNPYDVPTDVFKEYWELRLQLTEQAVQKMGKAFRDEAEILEDLVSSSAIVQELKISPNTLYDLTNRGLVRGEKINGLLYIKKEDYEKVLSYYKEHPPRKRRAP